MQKVHFLPYFPLLFILCIGNKTFGQDTIAMQDSIPISLSAVKVEAFQRGRNASDVAAPIGILNRAALDRFTPANVVAGMNTIPGVRMEERSPGSYRLNIRGSSLRAPFGVRNVKVYYNDIPITDPGGQTYLNALGKNNFRTVEVVKGPGSSLYGSGNGGVLLLEGGNDDATAGLSAEATTGSFGLKQVIGALSTGNNAQLSRISFEHLESDGYRDQSFLRKNVHNCSGVFRFASKRILKTTFLYSDLLYGTPGALTNSEFTTNPRAARPAAGGFPGAVDAHASISQRSFLAGASYTQNFAPNWENKSVLYGMFTELKNPAIRNFGQNSEPHVGGRTSFTYSDTSGRIHMNWLTGAEWQQGFSEFSIYRNRAGRPDSLQTLDNVNTRQEFLFTQLSIDFYNWEFSAGASLNELKIDYQRFQPASNGKKGRIFKNELTPRFSISRKIGNAEAFDVLIYAAYSKGFSPPTTGELLPTGSAINLDLSPERGRNIELGTKARIGKHAYADMSVYDFRLTNTIVQRRDAGGGDFFINGGSTKQFGLESALSYAFRMRKNQPGMVWLNFTAQNFRYEDFVQITNDYSGNRLPGVAPHTVSAGFEIPVMRGLGLSANYFYSDHIYLNDGNTDVANCYQLMGARIAYAFEMSQRWKITVAAGGENLFDERYSLGNDLNAFGGRYYNAAPTRNFFLSLKIAWMTRKIFQ